MRRAGGTACRPTSAGCALRPGRGHHAAGRRGGLQPALHHRLRGRGLGGGARVSEPRAAEPLALAGTFLRVMREGLESGWAAACDSPGGGGTARGAAQRCGSRCGAWGRVRRGRVGLREEFARAGEPLFHFLYDRWWRVRVSGIEHVPAHGRALLTANHAGNPALGRDHDCRSRSCASIRSRYPRFLVLNWRSTCVRVHGMRRVGGVAASPQNALGCWSRTSSWPCSRKGSRAPASVLERYRLQRFGRGGFVELALRAGARSCGGRRGQRGRSIPQARRLGSPRPDDRRRHSFPLLPRSPGWGRWGRSRCRPSGGSSSASDRDRSARPEAAADRALVLELSERVRETIQRKVHENVVRRGNGHHPLGPRAWNRVTRHELQSPAKSSGP